MLPNGMNQYPVQYPMGMHGGGVNPYGGYPSYGFGLQKPIYLINKRIDWFSWLMPLLLLLGAPLLLGIFLIPVSLKSIIFLLQILKNLGKYKQIWVQSKPIPLKATTSNKNNDINLKIVHKKYNIHIK